MTRGGEEPSSNMDVDIQKVNILNDSGIGIGIDPSRIPHSDPEHPDSLGLGTLYQTDFNDNYDDGPIPESILPPELFDQTEVNPNLVSTMAVNQSTFGHDSLEKLNSFQYFDPPLFSISQQDLLDDPRNEALRPLDLKKSPVMPNSNLPRENVSKVPIAEKTVIEANTVNTLLLQQVVHLLTELLGKTDAIANYLKEFKDSGLNPTDLINQLASLGGLKGAQTFTMPLKKVDKRLSLEQELRPTLGRSPFLHAKKVEVDPPINSDDERYDLCLMKDLIYDHQKKKSKKAKSLSVHDLLH